MNEIEEMRKIICEACKYATGVDDFIPCNEICEYCKLASEAFYNTGYRKQEVKTNGDYVRKITIYTDGGKYEYSTKLVHKQEYKGE